MSLSQSSGALGPYGYGPYFSLILTHLGLNFSWIQSSGAYSLSMCVSQSSVVFGPHGWKYMNTGSTRKLLLHLILEGTCFSLNLTHLGLNVVGLVCM